MKKSRKFQANDKVFAKVRGYPPWPAKVVGVADESSRMKYHIYFYGTGETAVVKAEDVFSYVENRNGKLGKPRKLKGFNEAVEQIENELSPEERLEMESRSADSANVSVLSDGSTPNNKRLSTAADKDSKASASTDRVSDSKEDSSVFETSVNETKTPKARKRKSEISELQPESKKAKVESYSPFKSDNSASEESPSKVATDITSRSGRKIKPKKFSDFDETLEEDNISSLKNKAVRGERPKSSAKAEPDRLTDDELIFTHNGETVKIPLYHNKPTFKNHKSSADWRKLVVGEAETLKNSIISGDTTPELAVKSMEEFTKDKLQEKKREYEEDDRTFAILHVEGRLLQLDLKIRSSLGLNKAEPEECLNCMDEFSNLPITALMLKKNPEVVETFKRLRRYVGNTLIWNMNDDETKAFNDKAQNIRNKADHIFNKMKGLFTVPEGKSFWSVFTTQLVDFNKVTRKLSQADFYAITEDPIQS